MNIENCIITSTGRWIDFKNPNPRQINIEDIAGGLSNIPRFAGQTYRHYSVAEHSIRCMMEAPDNQKLEVLMHDATEAYMGDIATPLKSLLPDYKKIESMLNSAIIERFKLNITNKNLIKEIDWRACCTEASHFFERDTVDLWATDKTYLWNFHSNPREQNQSVDGGGVRWDSLFKDEFERLWMDRHQ